MTNFTSHVIAVIRNSTTRISNAALPYLPRLGSLGDLESPSHATSDPFPDLVASKTTAETAVAVLDTFTGALNTTGKALTQALDALEEALAAAVGALDDATGTFIDEAQNALNDAKDTLIDSTETLSDVLNGALASAMDKFNEALFTNEGALDGATVPMKQARDSLQDAKDTRAHRLHGGAQRCPGRDHGDARRRHGYD